ncbi:MAG: SAM-dependent methyltransferase [Planctomycetota bacterium]|nr:MAG: SAM-dependent methyltransferase [Planctomycetota bacterium]
MFAADQYELIDFGLGRKLERFGPYVLDRPALAAADFAQRFPDLWKEAHARYERTSDNQGIWRSAAALPECWTIRHEPFALEIKPTPFGHVGVFPEQAENWDWIAEKIRAFAAAEPNRRPRVLNLFAYTGGSTLAAAAAGAEVVHVDAAANTVAWARRNAELSALAAAPIRWLVEDARKFVDRELRRGNKYDMVIADPPAYGHGPKGQTWQLLRDWSALEEAIASLVVPGRNAMLLTHHCDLLCGESLPGLPKGREEQHGFASAWIADRSGRRLHSGFVYRQCSW